MCVATLMVKTFGIKHNIGHLSQPKNIFKKENKKMITQVYEDKYFQVISPTSPQNSREDGGHLILIKKKPVHDRSDLTLPEAIDFMRITMMVGKAMYNVLSIERMNYEDLGNWGLDEPNGSQMHLHFFGRAKTQIHQIRGQHMMIFPKDHPIYDSHHLKPLSQTELKKIREEIKKIAQEPKYRQMAQLADS